MQTHLASDLKSPCADLFHGAGAHYVDLRSRKRAGMHFDRSLSSYVNLLPNAADEDLELVAAMARGDERAASRLYDRHSAVMYGLALRMVGESADAEEVVLEAFAQAWRDAVRYDTSRGSVVGWLTTIARTRALDLIRARGRRSKMTDTAANQLDAPAAMGEGFRSADALVDDAERATAVASALNGLPDAQRRAIELAFFEGLTHPEVAERLREPLGTVKTRIRLGMQKLRDLLAGLAPEGVS
jgi:RNA polymerase sigma-70 factor (ECF subfamily)